MTVITGWTSLDPVDRSDLDPGLPLSSCCNAKRLDPDTCHINQFRSIGSRTTFLPDIGSYSHLGSFSSNSSSLVGAKTVSTSHTRCRVYSPRKRHMRANPDPLLRGLRLQQQLQHPRHRPLRHRRRPRSL